MKLPQPFFRLPLKFDVQRLQHEVSSLPDTAWAKHPNEIPGNSSVRLISVDGAENDLTNGAMRPTQHLKNSPYIRQILASFGVVWSRSRLMRLAPGAGVPQHADINYHWFNRVRLHIPVVTRPEVQFHCDPATVHMAAGEAWLFDNWRLHRVENPTEHERIHLVADTSGSAAFWQFVLAGETAAKIFEHRFDPQRSYEPLTEHNSLAPVMHPAEVEMLLNDLRGELMVQSESAELQQRGFRYHATLEAFCKDWRQLYLLHGEHESGLLEFTKLRDSLRQASQALGDGLIMRTNRVAAHSVLEGRVLRAALSPQESTSRVSQTHSSTTKATNVVRPVFIVAAPRSGSTLLFETLAVSPQLATLGGEAHWLVESIAALQPGAPDVDSNRLNAKHLTQEIGLNILQQIAQHTVDSGGNRSALSPALRLLEKTPKNALRIPFFNSLFPDAQFIFLWRDPRENVSSIIEAWRSGNWKTYNGLQGFDGPWSLLLPSGWKNMNGKPLEEIAAFQWEAANRTIVDDLEALSRDRWTHISYAQLIADPSGAMQSICKFLGIDFDSALQQRTASALPLSRYTQTPPAANKWRSNAIEVERVIPRIELTWQRLQSL